MPAYDMMRECEDCKDVTQGGQGGTGNTGTPPPAPPPAAPATPPAVPPTAPPANNDNTETKGPYDNKGANPNLSGNTPGSDTPATNPPAHGDSDDAPCSDEHGPNGNVSLGSGSAPPMTQPKDNPPAPTSTPPVRTTTPPATTPLTSSTTPPATPAEKTPSSTPPSPAKPLYVQGDVPLWNQRPKRSDMAPLLGVGDHWKELAAVADAIIGVSPG